MRTVETILTLLVLTTALAFLARKVNVPYPIVLVVAGMGLAFVPGLPRVTLDPQIVFLLFLPPILYAAGYFTSWRDFRTNLFSITLLAVGLVIATTTAVGAAVHALVPGIAWPVALVLGAIVSPPDAVAATAIAQRLHLPRQIVTILEGESLVNDATGLVLLKFATAAVVTGSFSIASGVLEFLLLVAGGIAVGLAMGFLFVWLQRFLDDADPRDDGVDPRFVSRLHRGGAPARVGRPRRRRRRAACRGGTCRTSGRPRRASRELPSGRRSCSCSTRSSSS